MFPKSGALKNSSATCRRGKKRWIVIIHITHRDNLQSIQTLGILSPADAIQRGGMEVFDSDESNRDVVQLFDLRGALRNQQQNVLTGICSGVRKYSVKNLVVIECGPNVERSPSYILPSEVSRRCQTEFAGRIRHYPHFEAWFTKTIPPEDLKPPIPLPSWCKSHHLKMPR